LGINLHTLAALSLSLTGQHDPSQ